MKQRPFFSRFLVAISGLVFTWQRESSFRFQSLAAVAVMILLAVTGADPLWWAIMVLIVSAILAAELFNTALEKSLDHLHPELHGAIKVAKDCAAASVLILSFGSLGILSAYLISIFR